MIFNPSLYENFFCNFHKFYVHGLFITSRIQEKYDLIRFDSPSPGLNNMHAHIRQSNNDERSN